MEVLSNTATLAEISSKYSFHPTMVSSWKTEFLERTKNTFADPRKKSDELREKEEAIEDSLQTNRPGYHRVNNGYLTISI